MKKIVLSGLLLSASTLIDPTICRAEVKIGYIRTEYIIELLPDYESAAVQFETFTKKLEEERTAKFKGIQDKAAALGLPPSISVFLVDSAWVCEH